MIVAGAVAKTPQFPRKFTDAFLELEVVKDFRRSLSIFKHPFDAQRVSNGYSEPAGERP